MSSGKKYGLIIKKKPTPIFSKVDTKVVRSIANVFGNDGSSDEGSQQHINLQIHREAMKKVVKKQTKLEIQKALEEDSSVYEYDSIYDDMKAKKEIKTEKSTADKLKKPKYIGQLLKASEKRNRERQRIEERKIERERLKEGGQFKDKPAFVTSAYRKRMQEREEEEEEERKQDAIEDLLDVRKQKDLTGFYRHFLKQKFGEESSPSNSADRTLTTQQENDAKKEERSLEIDANPDQDSDLSLSDSSEDEVNEEDVTLSDSSTLSNDPATHDAATGKSAEEISHARTKDLASETGQQGEATAENELRATKFAKRSGSDNVMSARERYLARKNLGKTRPSVADD